LKIVLAHFPPYPLSLVEFARISVAAEKTIIACCEFYGPPSAKLLRFCR